MKATQPDQDHTFPQLSNIKRLLYIICFDQLAMTISFPLITLIFFDSQSRLFPADTSVATRSLWYGVVNALPNLTNIFFSPLISALSDVYGRRQLLLFEIASGLIFALSFGYGLLYGQLFFVCIAFFIRGAFARTNPTALAIIGDATPASAKMLWMGYLQFAISVGAFFGPLLGGYLATRFFFNELNYAFPLIVVGVITIINFCCTYRFINETLQHKIKLEHVHQNAWREVLSRKEVMHVSLILLFIQFGWSTYYQFMPPYLKTHFHFVSLNLGFFIGMIAFWLAFASRFCIKWLQMWCNGNEILTIAILLIWFGFLMTLLAMIYPAEIMLWLSAIPVAMGDVIAYTAITAKFSNVVAKEAQGAVMGFSFIITRIAWTATSLVGGYLMVLSPVLLFSFGFICIAFALIYTRKVLRVDTRYAFSEH